MWVRILLCFNIWVVHYHDFEEPFGGEWLWGHAYPLITDYIVPGRLEHSCGITHHTQGTPEDG